MADLAGIAMSVFDTKAEAQMGPIPASKKGAIGFEESHRQAHGRKTVRKRAHTDLSDISTRQGLAMRWKHRKPKACPAAAAKGVRRIRAAS